MITESGAKMFEPDKGRVLTEGAIRAGQHRRRQLDKLSMDPVRSLELMKSSHAYGPMIHWVGVDPFFVIYGNANQFLLFNAYKKHNKYTKITCDATGSIVHKLSSYILHCKLFNCVEMSIFNIFRMNYRKTERKKFRSYLSLCFGDQ